MLRIEKGRTVVKYATDSTKQKSAHVIRKDASYEPILGWRKRHYYFYQEKNDSQLFEKHWKVVKEFLNDSNTSRKHKQELLCQNSSPLDHL